MYCFKSWQILFLKDETVIFCILPYFNLEIVLVAD
jgi:hypothetical protein